MTPGSILIIIALSGATPPTMQEFTYQGFCAQALDWISQPKEPSGPKFITNTDSGSASLTIEFSVNGNKFRATCMPK
jgi:hypothetical protein